MEQKAFEQANDFALEKECTLGSQVECAGIQWCPTMDIAAIALVESRVQLLRFSGQKLWTTASKGETVQVTALRWRPDGKVLCVGYDNGQVDLLDVETGATLYNMNVQDKDGQHTNESDTDNTPDTINESEPAEYFVTCLDWVTEEGAPTSIIEAGTASATALANQALSRGVGSHRGTEGGETLGTGCDCMCHIGPSYANGREEEGDHAEQFADLTSTCTRTLPPLFGISECCVKDVSMYTSTDRRPASAYLDVLVLGLNSGTVSFYAKGLLSLGSICVGGKGCVSGGIHSVRLGSDLSTLVATVAQTDKRHAREIFRQDSNASGTAEEALSSSSLYEANASVDAARTIEKRNTSTRTNSNDKTYTDIDTLTGTNDHTDMNTVIGAETGGGIGTHAGPNTSDVRGLDHNDTLDEALEMLTLVVVDVRAIGRRREALRTLAAAYSHCIALEDRAWGNFQSMEKSWEGLVHEFGQRLERYEQQQLGPTEDIGTQLLRLLTLGIAPDTLQHLLLHDLNEAETRKMAISMEQSYSAILRFAVNPMFGTSLAMLRQAVHLIGYARKRDHAYTRVGVSEVTCVAAVQAATGVCMKTSELIAVVHQARNQFKQFFMWLWVNILKLKEKTVPKNYLRHNTEQAVGQFLRSHIQTGRRRKTDNSICKDEIGDLKNSTSAGAGAKSGSGGGRSQFMEETVGQYFVNQPLTIPAGRSGPDAMRVDHSPFEDNSQDAHAVYSRYWAQRLTQMDTLSAQAETHMNTHPQTQIDPQSGIAAHIHMHTEQKRAGDGEPLTPAMKSYKDSRTQEHAETHEHAHSAVDPRASLCQQLHTLSASITSMFAGTGTAMGTTYTVQSRTPLCAYDDALIHWSESLLAQDGLSSVTLQPLMDSVVGPKCTTVAYISGLRGKKVLWVLDIAIENRRHRNQNFSFETQPTVPDGNTTAVRLPIGAVVGQDGHLSEAHEILDLQMYDLNTLLILLQISPVSGMIYVGVTYQGQGYVLVICYFSHDNFHVHDINHLPYYMTCIVSRTCGLSACHIFFFI